MIAGIEKGIIVLIVVVVAVVVGLGIMAMVSYLITKWRYEK